MRVWIYVGHQGIWKTNKGSKTWVEPTSLVKTIFLEGLTAEGFLLPPGKRKQNKTNEKPRVRVASPFLQGAVEDILQYALHSLHLTFVFFRSSSAPEVDLGWWAGSGMTATPGTCWWSLDFRLSSRTTCPQPSLTGGTWDRWTQDSSMKTTAWCL